MIIWAIEVPDEGHLDNQGSAVQTKGILIIFGAKVIKVLIYTVHIVGMLTNSMLILSYCMKRRFGF